MYLWWNLYVYVLVASFFLHRLYLKRWIWPDGFLLPIFNIFKGMKNKKGKHHCLVHSVQLLTRVWMNCNNGVSCHHISHSKIAKIVFFLREKKLVGKKYLRLHGGYFYALNYLSRKIDWFASNEPIQNKQIRPNRINHFQTNFGWSNESYSMIYAGLLGLNCFILTFFHVII